MKQHYDQVAGDVNDLLAQAGDVEGEKLASVSSSYSSAVAEINERIRRATALVHKGLRDEAIQECEREPNLLDAFELLDIQDQEQWLSMHRILKVPIPPPLLVQQAAELNSAYAAQVPLTELLRKHRLLALGHAPLAIRIMVLRQISEKDPNSEIWHTDIKAYETERLAEIKSSLPKIKQSNDLVAIQSIYRELNNAAWIISVPADIRTQSTAILHQFEIAAAREKLNTCSANLLEAFSEFDLMRGFEARDEWELYHGPATLPPEAAVLAETQPALDWLAEQETRQQREDERLELVDHLETLLDDDASSKHELDATYVRLSATETDLPKVLRHRYRNRIQAYRLKEHRAQTLKILGTVGGLAILAGAIFIGLRTYQRDARSRTAANELDAYRRSRSWQEGLSLVEVTQTTAPQVFGSTAFQEARLSFQENLDADKTRESEFQRLVESIRAGDVTIEDAPEISALKKLAITDEEKQLHAELDSQKNRNDAEKEAIAREQFGDLVRQIGDDFKSESLQAEDLKLLLVRIEDARNAHPYALRGRNDAIRLTALDETLESLIEKKIKNTTRDQRLNELVASLHSHVGTSMALFAHALKEMRETLGESEPGRQLADTLNEQQIWMSVANIQSAVSPIANRAHATTVEQAQIAVDELKVVSDVHGDLPTRYEPLQSHLVAITGRAKLIQLGKVVPKPIRDEDSPHAELVKDLLRLYDSIIRQPKDWEIRFREILSKLVSDESADPLLKLKLLRVAVSKSVEGSLGCKLAFEPLLKKIESAEAESILRQEAKEEAAQFIRELPFQKALGKHSRVVKALGEIPKSVKWVGWLHPSGYDEESQAGVQCYLRTNTPDGDLFVLVSGNSEAIEFQKLGIVKNGEATVTDESSVQLGRPVYWTKSK